MNSNLKYISIDLNFYFKDSKSPTISEFEVEYFTLKEGDRIIGFQDDQEWEGIVRYDLSFPEEKKWYLDISNGKEYAVSKEKMKGRSEGGRASIPIGEIKGETAVVTKMLRDGIDVETIKKYTRLSLDRLNNLKKMIEEK